MTMDLTTKILRRRKLCLGRRRNYLLFLAILLGTFGCSDNVKLPSSEELIDFRSASPPGPTVDTSRIIKARIATGPYRVMPDEVIQFTMPAILKVVTADETGASDTMEPYLCRVSKQGTITLPVIGEMTVAGLSLAEIEDTVINAYYPLYTKMRPSVFATVQEFKKYKVTISGAVRASGVYELRWDQMTLVNLLMAAGGIADQGQYRGAALIRINRNPYSGRVEAPDFKKYSSQHVSGQRPLSLASLAQWSDDVENSIDDIQLTFRPNNDSATGRLHIQRQGVILADRMIDLTNSEDRYAALRQVSENDPGVSIAELNQRLLELAHTLLRRSSAKPSVRLASYGGLEDIDGGASPSVLYGNRRRAVNPPGKPQSEAYAETIILPVKGLNIPFSDVAVHEGDSVIVERLVMPIFTVLGLVNSAGNYEYPPDLKYNLIQALGYAGGLNLSLDPRYVTIYRLKQDGNVARVTFKLMKDSRLTEDLAVPILPGDIIAVEHTPRTRTTQFFNNVFRMSISTYFTPNELFD